MIDQSFADQFAAEWVDAWNRHDLEAIMSHYTDDFRMTSPVIRRVVNEESGTLRGKAAVGAYWARALQQLPDLRFELLTVCPGVNSVALYYRSPRGLAVEVFHFGPEGKVYEAFAHYFEE